MKKLHIDYKMLRGENDNEVAETCIDLPISDERYAELKVCMHNNPAWRQVQTALETLTRLQNYERLGTWSVELEIADDKE
jgi:hypothetical protein